MPIEDDFRCWETGAMHVHQENTSWWYMADEDQRRIITVKLDEMPETDEIALGHLRRFIDTLGPDVKLIHVAPDGSLVSVSTDPKDDETTMPYYPPLELFQRPEHVHTILRSELRELDRLIGQVDLVSYATGTGTETTKAIFKTYWHDQFVVRQWDEMNLWMRLPLHPNILPIDRLVLHEHSDQVLGFTTRYIPGGTLDQDVPRTFKLKWCNQLTQVIDELNLRYGIEHQDVVPRNLLVDQATDNILLFDFNVSAQIGRIRPGEGMPLSHWDIRNDVRAVVFTVYEIITRDFHFREGDWAELDLAMVQDIEWVAHPDVELDHPVAEYRALLNAWLKAREEGPKVAVYTDAPEYIDWPELKSPDTSGVFPVRYRREEPAGADGKPFVNWQRPPQSKLVGDYHLLSNGQLLDHDGA